jgi:predicted transposase/invertase (TIGR01784 family)
MTLRLDEPLGIDPCVDVVFLWLFGAEQHERIRVNFLNALLAPESRIAHARVLNPVHPGAFDGQAEIRLDIQVVDEQGRTFQIEMQRKRHRGLDQRMLYGWARLYAEQLGKSSEYTALRPVVSVWICEEDVFPDAVNAHLRFRLLEVDERFPLHDDIRFEIVQLSRVHAAGTGLADPALGGWCRFLNEADQWREVPDMLHNPVLEEAMSVLNEFRTDTHLNQLYRGRQEYERVRAAEVGELRDAKAERDAERAAKETALAAKETALAANEAERTAKETALAENARLAAEIAALRARLGSTDA